MTDGQLCINKESKELYNFVGNLNGDYHYNLGVFEDSFGIISIRRIDEFEVIEDKEAFNTDPIMYSILKSLADGEDK